jgi:hypothetical protein
MPTTIFDKESVQRSILGKLQRYNGVTIAEASKQQLYKAVAMTVRDQMMQKWMISRHARHEAKGKRVYYLSIEYLLGRLMDCNLINLTSEDMYKEALSELGIDLLSILPVLTVLNEGFRSLRVLRLFTTMRVLRVFKILRYSRNINIIVRVFRKQKDALIVVGWLVVGYIFVTALVVFNMEPRTFTDFFHALYWATISLTTVGYGDVYPMSTTGRFITMLSSVVGVAVIALPSSILTVGHLAEITEEKEEKRDDE